MQVIWKFPLNLTGITDVQMPFKAKILCVQAQRDVPCIWALVPDISAEKEERTFYIYGTGHVHAEVSGVYLGTFQMGAGSFVFHVFEKQS